MKIPKRSKAIPFLLILIFVYLPACKTESTDEEMSLFSSKDVLYIDIDTAAWHQIELSRNKALDLGILMTTDEDWQKAALRLGDNSCYAELRLKGDWPDHLRNENWSYRIRMKGGKTVLGMSDFSIQLPKARDYLNEWFMHQWLRKESVLTTYYDFIPVSINGKEPVIYAIEEHFDKSLVEKQDRREGPILRFDEESMWQSRVIDKNTNSEGDPTEQHLPTYETAGILPFKMAQLNNDPTAKAQFEIAQSLLYQFQEGSLNLDGIFDLDKMARYYAILDLTKSYHALLWHNQRFYFNPVIQKLEPIGYDGFTDGGVFDFINRPFIGYAQNPDFKKRVGGDLSTYLFFSNPKFVDAYAAYLHRFSQAAYIDSLLASLEMQAGQKESLIRLDNPKYSFDRNFFRRNAQAMSNALIVHGDNGVRAFLEQTEYGKLSFTAMNQYPLPIHLIGISQRKESIEYYFPDEVMLPAYNEDHPRYPYQAKVKGFGSFLFYRVPGMDSIFTTDILPWKSPAVESPQQELFEAAGVPDIPAIQLHEKDIHFKAGRYIIDRMIVIPEGYQVYFDPGCQLDFVRGAAFLSKSPLIMMGTAEQPIRILSSDSSAMGFTVLQAGSESRLDFVLFDHLGTLDYKGWTLLGAVNFYESDVQIRNCSFLHSQCEDALNVIRSEVYLLNCTLAYTWGDGFDADFSHGQIDKCTAKNTTNDGFDISGSTFSISNSLMKDIGDKGLSCGEKSNAIVEDCLIQQAPNGIVSKDQSKVTVLSVSLEDVGNAFAAYMKKNMWGPASLTVKSYQAKGVKNLSKALDGSTIELPK